jgi:hypothetical protein
MRILITIRSLESALEVGLNFQEYSRRVLDAKVAVDSDILQWPEASEDTKRAAGAAIELYVLARSVWAANLRKELIGEPHYLDKICPLRAEVKRLMFEKDSPFKYQMLYLRRSDLQILWKCAVQQRLEFERLSK